MARGFVLGSLVVLTACAPRLSAVIPLSRAQVSGSATRLSLPEALVELEVREGEFQQLRVQRPLAFETSARTNDLPWVIWAPARDATGVATVTDGPLELSSLRRRGAHVVVDAELDGVLVRDLVLPLDRVGLQPRESDVYVMDRFSLLSWGPHGLERLARNMLPRPQPPQLLEVDSAVAQARVMTPFWLHAAPDSEAAVRLEAKQDLEVEVLERGQTNTRIRLVLTGLRLEGWVLTRVLRTLDPRGVLGMIGSGEFPLPFEQEAAPALLEPPRVEVHAGVRAGAPLFDSPGGEVIAHFQLDRGVEVRLSPDDRFVEIVSFPTAFNPIRVETGRLFVRREDVAAYGAAAPGLLLEGANPFEPTDRQISTPWKVKAVGPGPWARFFVVGDELVEFTEAPSHRWTYPGLGGSSLEVGLDHLSALLFFAAEAPKTPNTQRRLVVRRAGKLIEQSLPLRVCGPGAICTEGFVEALKARCRWGLGVWRCD